MMRNEHVSRLAECLTVIRDRGDRLECLCPVPAHGDRRPSLSVAAGKFGGAVIHCHAGCRPDDVVAAVGLTMADLMPEPHKVRDYEYRNAAGEVLYTVERWIPKDFRCRPGLPEPAKRVLFQMDAIAHARATGETLYVVEGEEDAQTLWRDHRIPATCNALGAGGDGSAKWFPHYSDELAGLRVVIVADNDEPGRAHARAVARSLDGKAAFVALSVPSLGKDTGDLMDAGYTVPDGLVPLAEDDGIGAIRADRVQTRPIEWIWPGYIPAGKLSTIDGDPGDGKSTLTIDLVARLTTGRPLPGQPEATRNAPCNVVMVSAEDDPEDTISPRLRTAGADMNRVWLIISGPNPDHPVDLARDLPSLERLIRDENVAWLVIDPLMAFLPANTDAHRDNEVRRALQPLAMMARRTGAAVTTVRHLNKGSGKALYRGGGSIAFVGAARAAFLVGQHPEDENQRVMVCVKMNVAVKPDALGYRITSDPEANMPRVEWSTEPVGLDAQDIVDGQQGTDIRLARDDARDWLSEYLFWHGGGVKWADIVAEGRREGHSEIALRRVRNEVAVMHRNPTDSHGTARVGTYWYPPNRAPDATGDDATCSPPADLRSSAKDRASEQVSKLDQDPPDPSLPFPTPGDHPAEGTAPEERT